MQNKHIEHVEDLILTGDLSVLNALYKPDHISVKVDGAPAIVWGTHPENGKFFVCTKSAFNKKKIKVCYTEDDVLTHFGHQPNVALILIRCLKYLPKTEGVFQGDFIGFGGQSTYNPNTITYKFSEVIDEKIIIAPHTYYTGNCPLYEMEAHSLTGELISTNECLFVQPFVDRVCGNTEPPKVNVNRIQFLSLKDAKVAKQNINALIRNGEELTDDVLYDILGCNHLVNLYQMIIEIKEDLMESLIVYGCPKAYINGEQINQEGFVLSYNGNLMKVVDRKVFSFANFTQGRFQ
mgnify:CR=1 FL=1